MDTILLVQLTGNTWERVDIFEDIPITLTIQQNDLADLAGRRAPYSKTIQLPDTNNNAILFEHYFEVNGIEFNPLQKIPCVVQYRGTDIFQGVLRMNSVTTNGEGRTYEVFILGQVSDFLAPIRNLQLQDLDYTDLNHELVYSALTKSWECVNDGVSGLFNGQILYPLINYGLDYQGGGTGATPTFTYDFGGPLSFDQSTHPVPASMFKPAIQLKSIVNRLFEATGYEVQSQFFDSEYFTSIYLDTFQNGKTGVSYVSGITNQNIFKTFSPQLQPDYKQGTTRKIFFSKQIGPSYDPLNNFTTNSTGNIFQVPYAGQYGFNVRFNVETNDPCIFTAIADPEIVIRAFKSTDPTNITSGTMFYESPEINLKQGYVGLGGSGPLPVNLFFDEVLNAGEFIQVVIFEKTNFANPFCFSSGKGVYTIRSFNDGFVNDIFGPMFELYQSPTINTELVDIRQGIPNIECVNFLKALIVMFNLNLEQDEQSRIIRIEPYNWIYNEPDRPIKDWTQKIDVSGDVKIEPLTFDLAKDGIWTYTFTDFEYLPKLWYDQYDFVFGREKFSSTSNLLVGENIYEVPFGSCPTSGVTNAPNFIIPQFYYLNNNQQAPYATKPHLFFWVGNRLAYKDALKTQQGSWYLLSGSTPVEWTTYPCVSHLTTLESKIPEVISDLNFRSTFDFFGNSTNQIQQFTNFNLFNTFWREYIANIYDPTNKRLTANFFFKPLDVYETNLKDKIWIKDSYFTIEKITDADLVNRSLTQISLIKNNIEFYKIEPPAPIYVLSPNEGYPTPQPFYYDLAFISTDKTLVCNGTATLQTFYSFGTGTLGNLDQVYTDIGTAYVLLPMGTYIRQQSSTTTFVCVDNYGRVLETTC